MDLEGVIIVRRVQHASNVYDSLAFLVHLQKKGKLLAGAFLDHPTACCSAVYRGEPNEQAKEPINKVWRESLSHIKRTVYLKLQWKTLF